MRTTRGFTLIELLVVMSIIAILSAMFYPVIRSSFTAAYQFRSAQNLHQLGTATANYVSDFDDTFPVAMSYTESGELYTWFGLRKKDGTIDLTQGSLSAYEPKKRPADGSVQYKDYLGDHSGYGYDWQALGSDFSVTQDFSTFPNCKNASPTTQLENPSGTVEFATSFFFRAPWLSGGDGQSYDFGFVSPPKDWDGVPNMDFRFGGQRLLDEKSKTLNFTGTGLILMADGSIKAVKQGQVRDTMFVRSATSNSAPAP